MSDTNLDVIPEQEAIDPTQPTDEQEVEQVAEGEQEEQEVDENGDPVAKPAEELFDIVWNGETKQLTKDEIKELAKKGFDYTQKTQTLAEERLRLNEERQIAQLSRQAEAELTPIRAQFAALQTQRAQYEQINWLALAQQDPARYAELDAQSKALDRQLAQVGQALNERAADIAQKMQESFGKHLEREFTELTKKVPEITDRASYERFVGDVTAKAAKHLGISRGDIGQVVNVNDHRAILLLRAAVDHLAQASKAPPSRPVTKAPEPPAKVARGSAPATLSPNRMSTEQWMRWRNKEASKR